MGTYRVAILGCGWVAGEHIAAYKNNPETVIVGVHSHNADHASIKMSEWGIDVPVFATAEDLMAEAKPDIVSVTSRPDFHVEQAIACAERGAHLILEKPIALNADELSRLKACVASNQTKSIVSFVLRWNPLFSIIRSLIDRQGLGELFLGEVDYYHGIGPQYAQFRWNKTIQSGGSSLLSAGCHAVDALVWFMGSRVTEVTCITARSVNADYKDYEYEPTQVSLLKFENGAVGKVTSCIECTAPYGFPIRLFGSAGTIQDNRLFSNTLMPGQTGYSTIPTILPDSGDVTHHPFQGEIDSFVAALNAGKDSDVNIEWASHIMEICYAAEESARQGKPVTLA